MVNFLLFISVSVKADCRFQTADRRPGFMWPTLLFTWSVRLFIWSTFYFLYDQLEFLCGQLFLLIRSIFIFYMVNSSFCMVNFLLFISVSVKADCRFQTADRRPGLSAD